VADGRLVLLAVAPVLSLGYATGLVFLVAAVVLGRRGRSYRIVVWAPAVVCLTVSAVVLGLPGDKVTLPSTAGVLVLAVGP
jgi:hypothetical protein